MLHSGVNADVQADFEALTSNPVKAKTPSLKRGWVKELLEDTEDSKELFIDPHDFSHHSSALT